MKAAMVEQVIELRAVRKEDLPHIAALRDDYLTWIHMNRPKLVIYGDQWKDWMAGRLIPDAPTYFVAQNEDHPFIGFVSLDEYSRLHASIRVGIDVAAGLRNQGFGGKICQSVKRYCFGRLNVHRLWTALPVTSKAAIRFAKRQGFKVDGKCREAFFRDGKYIDQVMLSILGDEYRE